MTRAEAELVRARELTNGRFQVPIPFEYIEDMTDVPVRVRRPNRDNRAPRRPRIRKGDWR